MDLYVLMFSRIYLDLPQCIVSFLNLKKAHVTCFCNRRLYNNDICDLKLWILKHPTTMNSTGSQMLLGTCCLCCQDLLNVRLRGCWDKGTWARHTCWKPHGRFRYVVSNWVCLFVYYGAFGLACISNQTRNLKFRCFHD